MLVTDEMVGRAAKLIPLSGGIGLDDRERYEVARAIIECYLEGVQQHPDDIAVDRFAAAMKAKLAKKRAEGYGGWDDPNVCTVAGLSRLLAAHMVKGDPVDVGNFAMMIHQRGATILDGFDRPGRNDSTNILSGKKRLPMVTVKLSDGQQNALAALKRQGGSDAE